MLDGTQLKQRVAELRFEELRCFGGVAELSVDIVDRRHEGSHSPAQSL